MEEEFSFNTMSKGNPTFVFESSPSMGGGMCGCLNACYKPTPFPSLRNPTFHSVYRGNLAVQRATIKLPSTVTLMKFTKFILTKLEVDKHMSKTVIIQALALVERVVCNSQTFSHKTFRGSNERMIQAIIAQNEPQTQEVMLTQHSDEGDGKNGQYLLSLKAQRIM